MRKRAQPHGRRNVLRSAAADRTASVRAAISSRASGPRLRTCRRRATAGYSRSTPAAPIAGVKLPEPAGSRFPLHASRIAPPAGSPDSPRRSAARNRLRRVTPPALAARCGSSFPRSIQAVPTSGMPPDTPSGTTGSTPRRTHPSVVGPLERSILASNVRTRRADTGMRGKAASERGRP